MNRSGIAALVAAAGLAWGAGSVFGQAVRVADGNWVYGPGDVGTCGKARAAERAFAARRAAREDPVGDCMACDAAGLTDVLNCDLDLELDPGAGTISGSNTFTIRSLSDGLTEFTFRLRTQFVISSAVVNGSTPITVTNPTTTTRVAQLDHAYNSGDVFTLTVTYSGVPVSIGGFGSIEFTTQNGEPLVQSLSEPYYSYSWWPCKDGDVGELGDNSDKFTVQMAVTAPETMASVSNGLLRGVDVVAGGKKRFRWASDFPTCPYLVFIASTVYNQWERTYSYPLPGGGEGTMPVQFSIYPANDTAGNRAAWEKCVQMLATYRPLYGEYPFVAEKYGIYNFNFGGGEEHQTYTGQGTFDEGVTSHELGHQWWGDNITCRTWADIWLNEGFATYTEALWLQYRPGSSGWPAYFAAMNNRRPANIAQSVYRTDLSSVNSIFSNSYSYRKPAWVLHSLRRVVGEETFFNILAAYREAYQGSAATTDDFAAVASAVAGRDLSWFFQEWIYGPGAPGYAWGAQPVSINGQNYLRVHIRQTQTSYPIFTMPIDLVVNGETWPVWNNAPTQWYLIPLAGPATSWQLDPNPWILTSSKGTEGYRSGPPKIIASTVEPGAVLGGAPAEITVSFSEGVSAAAADFVLSGPGGGAALAVGYDASTFRATLTPQEPLAPGAYTLRIKDTVAATAAGNARLDGEVGDPLAPFPSGDGLPLGDGVIGFTVEGQDCYANCDGSTAAPVLNVLDFNCFLNRFAAGEPYANCDGSTAAPVLNVLDFNCFLNRFGAGCP
jgi:hypothetical protein